MGIVIAVLIAISLIHYDTGLAIFAAAAGLLWFGMQFSKRFSASARQNAAASLGGIALIVSFAGMVFGLLLWAKMI